MLSVHEHIKSWTDVLVDEYHEKGSTNWKLAFFSRLKETQGLNKLPNISAQKQGNKQLIPHLEEGCEKCW